MVPPRVHAELRLGAGVRCGRKRVARLMREAGLVGIGYRRKRRSAPSPAPHADLVSRRFVADAPNWLWCTDLTEHPTTEGKVYCAAGPTTNSLNRRRRRRRHEFVARLVGNNPSAVNLMH